MYRKFLCIFLYFGILYIYKNRQFLFKKRFEVIEKQIFASEKIRNLYNCIYDYAHSFFGEDF